MNFVSKIKLNEQLLNLVVPVENIETLKSLDLNTGIIINLSYYLNKGDISGLSVKISDTEDDSLPSIELDNGNFAIILNNFDNPVAWGADNSGTIDSSNAINSCISYSGNTVINFSPGKYRCDNESLTVSFQNKKDINFNGSVIFSTNDTIPVLLGTGQVPENTKFRKYIIRDLRVENANAEVALKILHGECIIDGLNIYSPTTGLKIGDSSILSANVKLSNFYIGGYDGITSANGIVLDSGDNEITNGNIYGFNKSIVINGDGGGNIISNLHNLYYNYGDFNEVSYNLSSCIVINNSFQNVFTEIYADGFCTFITDTTVSYEGKHKFTLNNSIYYDYHTNVDNALFKFTNAIPYCIIKNNSLNISTPKTKASVIIWEKNREVSDVFNNSNVIIKNNVINYPENVKDTDWIFMGNTGNLFHYNAIGTNPVYLFSVPVGGSFSNFALDVDGNKYKFDIINYGSSVTVRTYEKIGYFALNLRVKYDGDMAKIYGKIDGLNTTTNITITDVSPTIILPGSIGYNGDYLTAAEWESYTVVNPVFIDSVDLKQVYSTTFTQGITGELYLQKNNRETFWLYLNITSSTALSQDHVIANIENFPYNFYNLNFASYSTDNNDLSPALIKIENNQIKIQNINNSANTHIVGSQTAVHIE